MYKEKELEVIKRQRIYDMNHCISEGLTIWDWKQNFTNSIFKVDSYWEKRIKKSNIDGEFYIWQRYYDGSKIPKDALCVEELRICNGGISKMVQRQVTIFNEVMQEEEIKNTCNEIIMKAIAKYKIQDHCIPGKENDMLASYIRSCLNTEIQDYIDRFTGTIRDRSDKEEKVYSPDLLLSLEMEVDQEDEDGNKMRLGDTLSSTRNITYQHEGYEPSETFKVILDIIEDDLSVAQKDILYLLSFTNNNNAETGRILKEQDMKYGRELRNSDEAYRVYVNREKDKIVKIIKDGINVYNINKVIQLRKLKEEIESFIDSDISEKDVIDYTVANIDKLYMDQIIYNLDEDLIKYLIINFIHSYNDDLLKDKRTSQVCKYILNGLYEYIEQSEVKIKDKKVLKVVEKSQNVGLSDIQIQINKYHETINKDKYKYKYYIIKDNFEEFRKNKDITIKGSEILTVEITRKDMDYDKYDLDCYYLGDYERNRLKNRKTKYGKLNLSGVKYHVK